MMTNTHLSGVRYPLQSGRKHWKRLVLPALVWLGLVAGTPPARAVEIDICEEVITEVLIPPIPQVTWECNYGFHCVVLPHCCVPGLCQLDPVCGAAEKIVGWTEAATEERVTFECRVENIDPKQELINWLRGHAAALDDAILPFVKDVVRQEILAAKASAVAIPVPVRTALDELTLPHRNSGQSKFRSTDITNARIISGNNALVSEYLREERGFAAITLGDLIVIRDDIFQVLVNPRQHATAAQLRAGSASCAFRDAMLVLAHELVHVRQYANLGFDAFINNYLIEALIAGYGTDSFETEAYAYSRPGNPGASTFGALMTTCSGTGVGSAGSSSGALTAAGTAAQKKLKECLDQKGAIPRTCFEQLKNFYPVTDAERSALLKPIGKQPPKLRADYYVKSDSGRLVKVITNEKLTREEVIKRLGLKPNIKQGVLTPPKLRLPKAPIRPLRPKPVVTPNHKPVTTLPTQASPRPVK